MSTSEHNWQINIDGNSQNAFGGDGHTFNQSVGSDSLDLEKLLAAVVDSLPPESRQAVQVDVIEPIRAIAAEKPPESEEQQSALKVAIMSHLSKLEPYIPYVRKAVAAFADGALRTMPPPAGWIVGGLLEVIRDHRQ